MDVSNAISGGEFQNVVMADHAHVTLASGGVPADLPDLPDLPGLPPVPTGFTGRATESVELLALLDPGAASAEPVLVASVAGPGGVGRTTLALAGLAATGLLRQSPEGGRWSMHDLVREYAAGHARAAGDRYAPHLRALLTHYAEALEEAHFGLDEDGHPAADGVGRVSDECSNPLAAAQLAESVGEWSIAFRVGHLLASYGPMYGERERLETAATTLRAARRLGDPDQEAEGWHGLGLALQGLGRYQEAADALRSALRLWTGHPVFRGVALFNLGRVLIDLGEFPGDGGGREPVETVEEPSEGTWGIPDPVWRFAEAVRAHEERRAAGSPGVNRAAAPAAGPQRTGEETGSA
ncbi:tetratricopeptide repeat protein [Kitasatospora hibisci]|uniref:tetratricopeptide repeat protein n=1 Tax=Kitasatospora hibisci TaxID=3369522 RepID=UPI003754F5D5